MPSATAANPTAAAGSLTSLVRIAGASAAMAVLLELVVLVAVRVVGPETFVLADLVADVVSVDTTLPAFVVGPETFVFADRVSDVVSVVTTVPVTVGIEVWVFAVREVVSWRGTS